MSDQSVQMVCVHNHSEVTDIDSVQLNNFWQILLFYSHCTVMQSSAKCRLLTDCYYSNQAKLQASSALLSFEAEKGSI